jgi:hypothetical protein
MPYFCHTEKKNERQQKYGSKERKILRIIRMAKSPIMEMDFFYSVSSASAVAPTSVG